MSGLRHVNVLVVGESGTGKSSVINLIFKNENLSKVSIDAKGCTNHCSIYEGSPSDYPDIHLKMYDTIGIEESDEGTVPRRESLELFDQLFNLINDGIDLLLFCIKMGRLTKTVKRHYQLFDEILLDRQIPCLLVITHCEVEDEMGKWWKENQLTLKKDIFKNIVHAISITTIQQTQRGVDLSNEYNQSRSNVVDSILKYSLTNRTHFIPRRDFFFANLKRFFESEEKIPSDLIELSQRNMSLPHLIFFIDLYSTTVQQMNQSRFFYQKLTNDLSQKYPHISVRSSASPFKSIAKLFPSTDIELFHPQPGGSISIIFIRHPKPFHQKTYLIKQQMKKFRCLVNQLNERDNQRLYLNENPHLKEYNEQLHSLSHVNLFKLSDFPSENLGVLTENQTKVLLESIELIVNHLLNQYSLNE